MRDARAEKRVYVALTVCVCLFPCLCSLLLSSAGAVERHDGDVAREDGVEQRQAGPPEAVSRDSPDPLLKSKKPRIRLPVHYKLAENSLNPLHQALNPRPSTLDPRPSTLDPRPSTLDPRPSTLDPRPSTPESSILYPLPSTLDTNTLRGRCGFRFELFEGANQRDDKRVLVLAKRPVPENEGDPAVPQTILAELFQVDLYQKVGVWCFGILDF
jgi:hypothetical protein